MDVEDLTNFLVDRVGIDYDELFQALTEYNTPKKPVVKKLKSTSEKAAAAKKQAKETKKVKESTTAVKTCKFEITRGAKKGGKCGTKIRGEGEYCSKHKNHKTANISNSSKNSGGTAVSISRNKTAKAWVVSGTSLVVKSPRDHTVIGMVSGKDVVSLNASAKKKVTELKLQVEEKTPSKLKHVENDDDDEECEEEDDAECEEEEDESNDEDSEEVW